MIHAYLHHQDTAPEIDQRPLIRPGEGIIVEWNSGPFDTLFEGGADDSLRGTSTVDPRYMETLPDPVLQAKREARQKRRRNGITLGECLDEFGKEEILSEMDTWYCPRCKEHRRASKKLELYRTPDILVFHLKRFSSAGYRRDKLDVLVDFPIDSLDLTQKVLFRQDGKAEIYDLFAVDNHYGGLGGGHYTAYAKSFVDGAWYDYNGMHLIMVRIVSTANCE
jgi:ubiquitin carboxyl-terminal hydrolase 4/11/15